MSAQWTYVDVAAARIQHYISRTPRLKGQRGASAWLSKVTSPQSVRQLLDTPATVGVEVNPEAGEADGVISVRFPEGPDPVPVARTLAASVRAALPAIELDAVWGTGPSYLEAYRDQIKARRAGQPGALPPLAWLPPPSEFPPLVTCAECRAGPAVDKIDIHEDQNVAVCLDCRARYQDRYRKPGLARHARRGERGDENGDGLPVYREEAALARALGRDPVAGTVQDFSELARLAAEDANRNHVATIYADGNMIGAFFDRVIAHRDPDLKARISAAVSAATRQALLEATRAVAGPADGTRLPVIPHIVGGDDLVVSVTADRAWLFAVTYLGEFRRRLASVDGVPDGLLAPVAPSASAGLVLAHAKFPFRRAAELAGEQLRAAKREFRGEEPAVAWLDVTRDGERSPVGQRPWTLADLTGLSDAVRALREQVPPSGRATVGRLIDAARPEVSVARVREHARRLEREAVLMPFLSSGDPAEDAARLAGALALARWW